MQIQFDTVLDEGRTENVHEFPAMHGAERSFRTERTAGPHFHLMEGGSVMLESPNVGHMIEGFGENGEVLE